MHGFWSLWSTTSTACSATCGGGTAVGFRTCTNPAPAQNGRQCEGEMTTKDMPCNVFNCPGTKAAYHFWINYPNFTLTFAERFLSIVVGGSTRSINRKSKIEIIEMPKANVFPNLPHLPKRISDRNIIGITDDSKIKICAVTIDSMIPCYDIFLNNGSHSKWNQAIFTMLVERTYAASVEFQNDTIVSWLITGGEKHDSDGVSFKKLDTTEIFSHSNFMPGPLLPQAVSMHCIFKLNKTHIINTGGRGIHSRALHDVEVLKMNNGWGKLANMKFARYGHACGHYGMEEIIVAGGLTIKESEKFSIKFLKW